MAEKDSETIEITLAKAYGVIGEYNYCEDIAENLLSHRLINEDQCQCIRSAETPDKNE